MDLSILTALAIQLRNSQDKRLRFTGARIAALVSANKFGRKLSFSDARFLRRVSKCITPKKIKMPRFKSLTR